LYKSEFNFLCDTSAGALGIIKAERVGSNACEYSVDVHTNLVCEGSIPINSGCSVTVGGYTYDFSSLAIAGDNGVVSVTAPPSDSSYSFEASFCSDRVHCGSYITGNLVRSKDNVCEGVYGKWSTAVNIKTINGFQGTYTSTQYCSDDFSTLYKSEFNFLCDTSAGALGTIKAERVGSNSCEYSVDVHTNLVCEGSIPINSGCSVSVGGYTYNLSSLDTAGTNGVVSVTAPPSDTEYSYEASFCGDKVTCGSLLTGNFVRSKSNVCRGVYGKWATAVNIKTTTGFQATYNSTVLCNEGFTTFYTSEFNYLCDKSAGALGRVQAQTLGSNTCQYAVYVHTNLVCEGSIPVKTSEGRGVFSGGAVFLKK